MNYYLKYIKTISRLLIFIFIFNSFGSGFIFILFKYQIKSEIKSIIKSGNYKSVEITLTINENDPNLRWIHSREFVFNDNMYDVISMKKEKEMLIIRCIEDYKEKQLIKNYSESMSNFFGNDSSNIGNKIKKLIQLLHYEFILNNFERLIIEYHKISYKNKINTFFQNYYLIIPQPPP